LSKDREQQRRGRNQQNEHDHSEQREGLEGELTYKGRQISYMEEKDRVLLWIDGVEVGPVAQFGEEYETHFFPFRTFPSLEALIRVLVDTEGELWVLDRRTTEQER